MFSCSLHPSFCVYFFFPHHLVWVSLLDLSLTTWKPLIYTLDVKAFINIGITCVLPYSHPLILSFLLFWLSCFCFLLLSLTLQYRLSAYTSSGNLWLKIMGFSSNSLPNMHLHFSLIIKVEIRSIHFKLIPTISTTSSFFSFSFKNYILAFATWVSVHSYC